MCLGFKLNPSQAVSTGQRRGRSAAKGDVERRRGSTTPVFASAGHAVRDGVGRDGVGSAQHSRPREQGDGTQLF